MSLKEKLKHLNYRRIAYHILFWVVLSFFYDAVSSWVNNRSFFNTLIHDLLYFFPSDILGVYFTLYFLFPKFLLKKKYISFTVWFFVFFAFLMFAVTMPLQYYGIVIIKSEIGKSAPEYKQYLEHNFLWAITIKLMIIGIASAIKLVKIWYKTQKRQQALLNEKLEINLQLKEAELRYLKAQINPHFLFNALNNLYGLTLEKSDKAPEVVLKISSLLDYVLYECNVPEIELTKEIEKIEDYIDLQKIRYDDKVNIVFNIEGNPSHITIAPLLILPIIENAFKHGLDKNVGNGFVDIRLNVSNEGKFNVEVRNSLNGEKNHNGEGIGLKNLRKRLELQYPDRFQLNVNQDDRQFFVKLCIDLN